MAATRRKRGGRLADRFGSVKRAATSTHGVARRFPDGPTTSRPCRVAPPGPHKRGRVGPRARHGRQYRDFFAQQQSDPEVPARRAQRPAGSSDTGGLRSLDLSALGTTRRTAVLEGVFAWSSQHASFDLSTGGEADLANGLWVSASFFDVLGVQPILGRTFVAADDRRGGGPDGPVAVVSHSFSNATSMAPWTWLERRS